MKQYLTNLKNTPKHARLYILKSNLGSIVKHTDDKFDLYTAKNGSRIKGAIEIMSTVIFILDTPNKESIRFLISDEYFENVFNCKAPEENKHTVVRTYVKEDSPLLLNREENFRGDVYWVKGINPTELWKFMTESLLHFMRHEFSNYYIDSITDVDVKGTVKTHSTLDWMVEYRLEVTVTPELLSDIMRSSPRLFNRKLDFMLSHEPKRYFNSIEV